MYLLSFDSFLIANTYIFTKVHSLITASGFRFSDTQIYNAACSTVHKINDFAKNEVFAL